MKVITKIFRKSCLALILSAAVFLFSAGHVHAAWCEDKGVAVLEGTSTTASAIKIPTGSIDTHNVVIDGKTLDEGNYWIQVYDSSVNTKGMQNQTVGPVYNDKTGNLTFVLSGKSLTSKGDWFWTSDDVKRVYLYKYDPFNPTTVSFCQVGQYTVTIGDIPRCPKPIQVYQVRDLNGDGTANPDTEKCYASRSSCVSDNGKVILETSGLTNSKGEPFSGRVEIIVNTNDVWAPLARMAFGNDLTNITVKPDGSFREEASLPAGEYRIRLLSGLWGAGTVFRGPCSSQTFVIKDTCDDTVAASCNTTPLVTNSSGDIVMEERLFELCSQVTNTELRGKCDECYDKEGVWTAVGCVERTPQSIVKSFLEIGLGVGGGICLLMCLTAGFMLTTSQGDPKQVTEAREMITSAIIGLLFIIFSVFILQFIGVTIFNIPGFGAAPTVTP